uniref:Uncharacterized protein n=1 Tax=Kalanchoe fedtschenkoi TaxID=63787 RepID=A0A7N0TIZ5_KALFE
MILNAQNFCGRVIKHQMVVLPNDLPLMMVEIEGGLCILYLRIWCLQCLGLRQSPVTEFQHTCIKASNCIVAFLIGPHSNGVSLLNLPL